MTNNRSSAPTTASHIPPLQRPELLNVIDFIKTFDHVENYIEALESFEYSFSTGYIKKACVWKKKTLNIGFSSAN